MPYDITYMWNLKYVTNDPIYKTNRSWIRRADLWLPGGGEKEWDGWGVWGWWIQTVTFGIDGQWGSTVHHRELCVTKSLCCATEIEETL